MPVPVVGDPDRFPGASVALLFAPERRVEAKPVVDARQGIGLGERGQLVHPVPADLVVINTHGRAGTEAFWSGSAAAQAITGSRRLLLLVPLKGDVLIVS